MRIIKIILTALAVCWFLFCAVLIFDLARTICIRIELGKTNYHCELRDPTYREMKEFLARDKTDLNKYKNGIIFGIFFSYDCENFTRDLKRNAIKENIRCAYVDIRYKRRVMGHAVAAFRTTDKGIIFIEPQTDEEIRVAIGVRYLNEIITKYCVFWPNLTK